MKKILLADDHSFIRLGLIQILKDEYPDVIITEVADGESLVKEAMKNEFDLVISDLDMPGRGGLEALEQIKSIKPELPVLILSIFTEDLYALRTMKAGASGYLNKNAAPYELINAIHRILQGRKYITPELAEKLLFAGDIENNPHEKLTNREFEIFKLLAQGKTNTQIAEMLFLAVTTVSTHRSKILRKMNLSGNADLTRYAITNHLLNEITF